MRITKIKKIENHKKAYEDYLYEYYYFPLNGGEYYTDTILEIEEA